MTAPEPGIRTILWGDSHPLRDQPVEIAVGGHTYVLTRVGERVVEIEDRLEEGSPVLRAALATPADSVRIGHVRRSRPVVVRFPKPIRLAPKAECELFSTYPLQPALYHVVEGKTPVLLLKVPVKPRKATWYGAPAAGVLCHLHFGQAVFRTEDLSTDPAFAPIRVRLENPTDEPRDVGILLLDPHTLDFHRFERRLCLNRVHVKLISSTEADLTMVKEASIDGAELVEGRTREKTPGFVSPLFREIGEEYDMAQGY